MLRCCAHCIPLALLIAVNIACATAPPPPPLVVPFETKMSWILRLEDQRILRDAAMPIVPPPATQGRRNVLPPPPPPPDLIRLLEDARGARFAAAPRSPSAAWDYRRPCPRSSGCCKPTRTPKCGRWRRSVSDLIGDQSAVEPLRAAVADPLPLVAGRAAEALGLLNDVASAPAIGKMVAAHATAAVSCRTRRRPRRGGWRC